jgi:uncharacterized Zn finger protein
MNEEVNIKVNPLSEEVTRLKNELAEAAKTIRELSAQLGQAKSKNNLDINAVIRNVVREEMQEIDIWSYESDIEDMARQVLDVDDIAYDVSQNFDIHDHSDTIAEIAREVIEQTEFDVSVK